MAHRAAERPAWSSILTLPQTLGVVLGKALTDPVWYFISEWSPSTSVSKGVKMEQGIMTGPQIAKGRHPGGRDWNDALDSYGVYFQHFHARGPVRLHDLLLRRGHTISGIGATGAGIGSIASTLTIGYVADHYSFGPILIVASLIPLLATAFVFLFVRKPL